MSIRRIYRNHGFDGLIYRLLKFLGFKMKYLDLIDKKTFYLGERIKKFSNQRIISGEYKDTYIKGNSVWNSRDVCSKYLGVYEKQIQSLIADSQKKFNLEYFVNFGASDGYHILGNLKNKRFKKGFAFEIDKKERDNLRSNIENNNLSDTIDIFGEANFKKILEIFNPDMFRKTLFLIDIEGHEFNLFNSKVEFPEELKSCFFIIENHSFLIGDDNSKKDFEDFINRNFSVEIIKNSERDPYRFDFIKDISDDDRWLMMSEQRPCEMYWFFLKPKN